MSKFNKNNRFHMERLEDRQMMAGDVTAFVNNGTLFITEDANDKGENSTVQVSQLSNGRIRVSGIATADNPAGSLVNGKASIVFDQPNGIDIKLGAGKDEVRFFGSPLQSVGFVNIDVADPGNSAADNDRVSITNYRPTGAGGGIKINTGAGQDVVSMVNSGAGTLFGVPSLEINTGVGIATGDTDRDVVTLTNVDIFGGAIILTGASTDTVLLNDVSIQSQGLFQAKNFILTGNGASSVTLENVGVIGTLVIDAGLDTDKSVDNVSIQHATFTGDLFVTQGGGNDILNMFNVRVHNEIQLRGSSGNDTMTINQVEAFDDFFAFMGAGDDTLTLNFVKAKRLLLFGEGDNDRLSFSQIPSGATQIRTGWEFINGVPTLQTSPNVNVGGTPQLQLR